MTFTTLKLERSCFFLAVFAIINQHMDYFSDHFGEDMVLNVISRCIVYIFLG